MTDPTLDLQCYLVGGAVRDSLLGLAQSDRDWVVVGSTVEEMKRRGFRQVGKDFPVFLHPRTGEEYALARRERKTGPGYTGFITDSSSQVTLEDDLSRRDLTINAMARDGEGNLIDPHGGAQDLEHGVLRHVSPAFVEDPLRVLRVARFAARYHTRGFTLAPETLELMKRIVRAGELATLAPERIWQETVTALAEPTPARFIEILADCGALEAVFPEIAALMGVPQREDFHPEGDVFVHTQMVLEAASALCKDPRVRFAALVHDLGKAQTPSSEWPRHIKHEQRGVKLVRHLCDRLKVPADYRDLAVLVTGQHLIMHRLDELRPETVLKLLNTLDAFRRPERLADFINACHADAQGRAQGAPIEYPQGQLLRAYFDAALAANLEAVKSPDLSGAEKKSVVTSQRIAAIRKLHSANHTATSL